MKYCKGCVVPDTRPGIYFTEDGICGACLYEEEKEKKIDWDARERELQEIAERAKKNIRSVYEGKCGRKTQKENGF